MDCEKLEDIRSKEIIDRTQENSEEGMVRLLFHNENHQSIGYMIKKLWEKRRNLLKNNEEEERRRKKGNNKVVAQQKGHYKSDPGPRERGCVYPLQRHRIVPVGSY